MKPKNKKLLNIYFVIIISILISISFFQLWTALKIGKMAADLTFKEVISLHKAAEIDRIYKGYEVLIIQKLGTSVMYLLFSILISTYFIIENLVCKYSKNI